MYGAVRKVSKSLLRHYTLPKFLARTAHTFAKVDYSDNQLLLECVM